MCVRLLIHRLNFTISFSPATMVVGKIITTMRSAECARNAQIAINARDSPRYVDLNDIFTTESSSNHRADPTTVILDAILVHSDLLRVSVIRYSAVDDILHMPRSP